MFVCAYTYACVYLYVRLVSDGSGMSSLSGMSYIYESQLLVGCCAQFCKKLVFVRRSNILHIGTLVVCVCVRVSVCVGSIITTTAITIVSTATRATRAPLHEGRPLANLRTGVNHPVHTRSR